MPTTHLRRCQRDEKLAPVRVRPAVGHRENPRPGVLQVRMDLVVKVLAVDAGPAPPSSSGIAACGHKCQCSEKL